jgi:hypothetical protein
MRPDYILLAAFLLLSCGCSSLIGHSGMDLSKVTTREEVHKKFGTPAVADDAHTVEDYRTRRKLAEPELEVAERNMGIAMTYGLMECVAFPCEVYKLGRNTLVGQDLRFTYDARGFVTAAYVDGQQFYSVLQARREQTGTPSTPPPPSK